MISIVLLSLVAWTPSENRTYPGFLVWDGPCVEGQQWVDVWLKLEMKVTRRNAQSLFYSRTIRDDEDPRFCDEGREPVGGFLYKFFCHPQDGGADRIRFRLQTWAEHENGAVCHSKWSNPAHINWEKYWGEWVGTGEGELGDCNGDGWVEISDVVYYLLYLFEDGPEPRCHRLADFNQDGHLNLSDAVSQLHYLFN